MINSLFEQNGGTYRQVGDFNIPNPEALYRKCGFVGVMCGTFCIRNEEKYLIYC